MYVVIKFNNIIVFTIVFVLHISTTACFSTPTNKNKTNRTTTLDSSYHYANKDLERLKAYAAKAKAYNLQHNYASNICFLIDMQLTSGKNRFFVYDMNKDSVVLASVVAHGAGGDFFTAEPRFSNTPHSKCSSLGKYKIGKKYEGNYGTAYKLYGLDASNSNAFNRFIVLHGYECVPDEAPDPLPICNSLGCPMVSFNFLKKLSTYIDQSNKPILLWIFN